ncbi:hypothetical protein LCGC14_1664950 [marine sediment metagenome]|uniref:Uncharacterized protein n=1 Tax=marine sediment metagenome TaxID=412755 RepID=A0A0F9IFN3_9ZZZZ
MAKVAPYLVQDLQDEGLKIAMGVYPGVSYINKFGHNPAVASGGTEEIWDGSAAYVFPATALMVKLSQTTDQVAMRGETVEIQGLDANYAAVTQDVVLANPTTTPVVLGTALIRVNRMVLKSAVVADQPIRLHNSAENQDYSVILVPDQQTEQAIYTIPAGVTAYMTQYYAAHLPTTGQTFTSLNIKVLARDNGNSYAPMLKHELGLAPDGSSLHEFHPYPKFLEKTDIYLVANTVGAAADVVGGFDLILVDN